MLKRLLIALFALAACGALYLFATLKPVPARVSYGATFSVPYAEELGLNWREAYRALLDDLKARKLRIPAYWPQVEPSEGRFDWTALDYLLDQAYRHDASVVLVVGFRQPRWPECFTPEWSKGRSWDTQKEEIRTYLKAVVQRYKDNPAVRYWQVENEPYLGVFGECGPLDEGFLKEELALVRSLDARPILVTDSGNLGLWAGPYRNGDVFGTSLYIYFWNDKLGQFKTKLSPVVYRMKERLMEVLFGEKPTVLIELSLEPWLPHPINGTPLTTQLERMDMEKFNEVIAYARRTGFTEQYLWGVEWWYYMKEQGHPEFWDAAKKLYDGTHGI